MPEVLKGREGIKFQLITAMVVVFVTAIVNIGFVSYANSRDDDHSLTIKLEEKVDKTDYEQDKQDLKSAIKENTDFRVQTGATLSSIQANMQWLVEAQKKENKGK